MVGWEIWDVFTGNSTGFKEFSAIFEDQKLKNNRKTKSQRKSHKDQKPLQFLHTKYTKSSYFMLTSSCTSWCLSPQHCVT